MRVDQAGEIIVAAIEARNDRVLVGSDAKAAAFLERIAPTHYWDLAKRTMR